MLGVLLQPHNLPFAVAAGLVVGLLLIEVVALAAGLGSLEGMDDWLDLEADGGGWAAEGLGWVGLGRVPFLVFLIVLLAGFAVLGLVLQGVWAGIAGAPLSPWVAAPAAFLLALPPTRLLCRGLARLLPREESSAVSRDSLLNREAEIILGRATADLPAEAEVRDAHGTMHYVSVRPLAEGDAFERGTRVVLVAQQDGIFSAARLDEAPPR